MITYGELITTKVVKVYLEGKLVGEIRSTAERHAWRYFPKGKKIVGEAFTTLKAVKQSLES